MDSRTERGTGPSPYRPGLIYTFDNPYLSRDQKVEVERWHQLPGDFLLFTFFISALLYNLYPIHWLYVVLIPIAVDFVLGLLNWIVYVRWMVTISNAIVGSPILKWLSAALVVLISALKANWAIAVFTPLAVLGLSALFEVHMLLYAYLSKHYHMNVKYVFFKRFYGLAFPFETS